MSCGNVIVMSISDTRTLAFFPTYVMLVFPQVVLLERIQIAIF
jgi:hypothetical protein